MQDMQGTPGGTYCSYPENPWNLQGSGSGFNFAIIDFCNIIPILFPICWWRYRAIGDSPRRVPSYLANAKNLRPTIQKLETQALILRPQKRKMSAAWYMGDISIVYRVYRYCRLKLITEGHNCCIHFVSRSSKTRKPAMKILTEYPVKWRSTQ